MNNEIHMNWLNWGPFVGKFNLDKSIIKRLHKDGKKELQSYHKQLAGHVKRQVLFNDDTTDWFYQQIQPILDTYRQGHLQYHGLAKREVKIGYDDLWINFMQPGDFNPMHTHAGDYSFVVFVDIPKSLKKEQDAFEGTSAVPGSLQFEYGVQARPPWATTGHAVIPETGQMLMFPALMQHWVIPYKTNCTRVTVSGNLRIMNRDELPPNYF
jgi:uncharacterized protein (TIGR02466 family)